MAHFLVPRRSTLIRRESTLEETLPTSHLVRFVWRILESIDFSAIEKLYTSIEGGPGRPPYHPRILAALWIYAMTERLETAAVIAKACTIRDDFRWLAGGLLPCDQTLLNFLTVAKDDLPSLWIQVLKAMHQSGHIDLSVLAEDGTKLRANASPRSFHTALDIDEVIKDLKAKVTRKIEELVPPEQSRQHQAKLLALQGKLQRAERAAQELQERATRRDSKAGAPQNAASQKGALETLAKTPRRRRVPGKFNLDDFRHDPEKDVMMCPAQQELRFVGQYPTDNGRGTYRLYKRADCTGCSLKAQCTGSKQRQLKVPVQPPRAQVPPPSVSPTGAAAPVATCSPIAAPAPEKSEAERSPTPTGAPCAPSSASSTTRTDDARFTKEKFSRGDFRHHAERDVMVCPAGEELHLVGVYPTDSGGAQQLYRRADCTGCSLKPQCTDYKGRRLKILVGSSKVASTGTAAWHSIVPEEAGSEPALEEAEENREATGGPQGSLTDPEAVFMLATSEKVFEPSYNADLTVTRHGIIVSQFLTKEPTDFGHFRRALPAVLSTLGRPDAWAGDGHYSTIANLLLAEQAGVTLYAPLPDRDAAGNGKFSIEAFRHEPERDVLVCPAGQELHKIGTYQQGQASPYDLYARKDCGECPLKSKCTDARGRRVKRLHTHPLVEALEARMKEVGEKLQTFRRCTVEPVNGQIKQHGVGRFHVRGLTRCGTVLTLVCIAHNLMKWKAREHARALKLAS